MLNDKIEIFINLLIKEVSRNQDDIMLEILSEYNITKEDYDNIRKYFAEKNICIKELKF